MFLVKAVEMLFTFFKNGPFPASFQYTVDSKQMFNIGI